MRRFVLAAAVLTVGGVGLAQDEKPDPDEAKREAEYKKQKAEERAKYFKNLDTELPDLAKRLADGVKGDEESKPKVAADKLPDTPACGRRLSRSARRSDGSI